MEQRFYLAHHGIKGQKWDVKNGPPYPLGSSQKSYAEKKHISISKRLANDKIKGRKSDNATSTKPKRLTHRDKLIQKYRDEGMPSSEAKRAADKRISIEKKVAIGVAVTAAAVTAYGVYKHADFGGVNANINLDSQLKRKTFEAPDFDRAINDDLRKINREDLAGHLLLRGREVNCTSCSMAYEMRRRGYDVVAGRTREGRTNLELERFFKRAEFDLLYTEGLYPLGTAAEVHEHVASTLLSQGEGARGIINGWYSFGGGHSIAYEVHGGKVHFVDGQIGRQYKDIQEALGNFYRADFLRTDTLALTDAAAETVLNNTTASLLTETPSNFAVKMALISAGAGSALHGKRWRNRRRKQRMRNGV